MGVKCKGLTGECGVQEMNFVAVLCGKRDEKIYTIF